MYYLLFDGYIIWHCVIKCKHFFSKTYSVDFLLGTWLKRIYFFSVLFITDIAIDAQMEFGYLHNWQLYYAQKICFCTIWLFVVPKNMAIVFKAETCNCFQ